MAQTTGSTGLIAPEISFARGLLSRHSLKPPVRVFRLAREYASVEKINIPFNVDGVAIKSRGKKPRILLNLQNTTPQRMRFTLAHELGHIIIPWHLGMIIEQDVGHPTIRQNDSYEAEANRFASELLMPSDWVRKVVDDFNEPQALIDQIMDDANVSFQAAIIRAISFVRPGFVYALVSDDGRVIFSDKSPNTPVSPPEWGKIVDPDNLYNYCEEKTSFRRGGAICYWWKFVDHVKIDDKDDPREWREVLDTILRDIGMPKSFKQNINGIIASRNDAIKRSSDPSPEALMAACLIRFRSDADFALFVDHPDTKIFLSKRVSELTGGW